MTDHLTDDDLRRARKIAEARFADLPHRDEDWEIVARAILAHVPNPGPAPLTKWSDDLVGTWAEDTTHGLIGVMFRGIHGQVETYFPDRGCAAPRLSDLTPRPDLARVDLTPRPIDPEATPRTVTTVEEYAALPDGSIVAELGGRALTLREERWRDTMGNGPHTHDRMGGTTRELLREGWVSEPEVVE